MLPPERTPVSPREKPSGSILGRFSVVVLVLTSLVSIAGSILIAVGKNTDVGLNVAFFGWAAWLLFLATIWVCGRYEEAVMECRKFPLLNEEGFEFWIFPIFRGFGVGVAYWLLIWAGKLAVNLYVTIRGW